MADLEDAPPSISNALRSTRPLSAVSSAGSYVPPGMSASHTAGDSALGVSVLVDHVVVEVPVKGQKEKKRLLDDITFGVPRSSLVALMGPSGAGKTTLSDVIAGQRRPASGAVRLDGVTPPPEQLPHYVEYVPQEDLFTPTLTVEQTLLFYAQLKCPQAWSAEERVAEVNRIIGELHLDSCRHTKIGNALIRGISGGEKRRLSAAVALLARPAVMLFDEVTTGLDSSSAFSLISMLRDLTRQEGQTVLTTLHQPSSRIFKLFDHVIILGFGGRLVYSGPPKGVSAFLHEIGEPVPPYSNPADLIFDAIAKRAKEIPQMVESFRNSSVYTRHAHIVRDLGSSTDAATGNSGERFPGSPTSIEMAEKSLPTGAAAVAKDPEAAGSHLNSRNRPSLWRQFSALYFRDLRENLLNFQVSWVRVMQAVMMGFFCSIIALRLDLSQNAVRSRIGALVFVVAAAVYSSVSATVEALPSARATLLRDRLTETYGVVVYYFAHIVSQIPFMAVPPLVMTILTYFMINFREGAEHFFIYAAFVFLIFYCGDALGNLIGSIAPDAVTGLIAGPAIVTIFFLVCGFFITLDTLPNYITWLSYISILRYAFGGTLVNELAGLQFKCTEVELATDRCRIPDGDAILRTYGFQGASMSQSAGLLFVLYLAYHILTACVLLWRDFRRRRCKA